MEDDPEYSLIIQYTNGEVVKYALGSIQSNEKNGQYTTHVIDHFVAAIVNDIDVHVSGEEGMKSLEVVLAALKSKQNKTIEKI